VAIFARAVAPWYPYGLRRHRYRRCLERIIRVRKICATATINGVQGTVGVYPIYPTRSEVTEGRESLCNKPFPHQSITSGVASLGYRYPSPGKQYSSSTKREIEYASASTRATKDLHLTLERTEVVLATLPRDVHRISNPSHPAPSSKL